jgi:hypothetical protein
MSYMQVTDTKLQEETIIFNGWVTQWWVWHRCVTVWNRGKSFSLGDWS